MALEDHLRFRIYVFHVILFYGSSYRYGWEKSALLEGLTIKSFFCVKKCRVKIQFFTGFVGLQDAERQSRIKSPIELRKVIGEKVKI